MKSITFYAAVVFIMVGCIQTIGPVDFEKEKAAILKLHNDQRAFHFEKRIEDFASLLSEDHISVNRGSIKQPTREEHITRFQGYFDAVEFVRWDDLTPPVIRFSDDGKMVYTIVHKDVAVSYENDENQTVLEETEFAWVAIYKKHGNEWKVDCVSSTNKPGIITPLDGNSFTE